MHLWQPDLAKLSNLVMRTFFPTAECGGGGYIRGLAMHEVGPAENPRQGCGGQCQRRVPEAHFGQRWPLVTEVGPWGIEAAIGRRRSSEVSVTTTITRRLVSLADTADALAVSTRTIRRYIADGQLEAVRLGRKTIRIKVDSIERFIDAKPIGSWR
jgi:excisionase family DNA binding protein